MSHDYFISVFATALTIESPQVLVRLADSDVGNGYARLVYHRHCGAHIVVNGVKLGEHDAVDAVLPRGGSAAAGESPAHPDLINVASFSRCALPHFNSSSICIVITVSLFLS
jgi:hypothetical protein